MNKPNIESQRSVLNSNIAELEKAAYNHTVASEAFQACGLLDEAKAHAGKLADTMKLHAFYTSKLNELIE